MNITQIEEKLTDIVNNYTEDNFIYELLETYDIPKATLTRLKKGDLNLSKNPDEIRLKRKLFYKSVLNEDLHDVIDSIMNDKTIARDNPRFIIVTDHESILASDTKTKDTLDIAIKDLPKHFSFFLPWAGIEKARYQDENPADVKAAERMAVLFDQIKRDNEDRKEHDLNVFLARLLFCYFAEDTGIFKDNQITNAIASITNQDGSDLGIYFDTLFYTFSTPKDERYELSSNFEDMYYVGGTLFDEEIKILSFTKNSRKKIIEGGKLDWSEINPDIFGSMIQSVVSAENRSSQGMHYTSISNIMKVIGPLFLDEIHEKMDEAGGNPKKLRLLLDRIQKIKIFDPACGSGNFLIITYKELRKLEMGIIQRMGSIPETNIHLSNFFGIEIDDFASQIAKLSLWLAEHQMNMLFLSEFGVVDPTLPLQEPGNIHCGNSTRLDWELVCPKLKEDEIYILGNPPYIGSSMQLKDQKEDLEKIFKKFDNYKNLDYIACWFKKATDYISKSHFKVAFVSTNSICQGEQVALLWPYILRSGVEIFFAHQSFKWINSAKDNAGVMVVIIGLRKNNKSGKVIFSDNVKTYVKNISPYLSTSNSNFIFRRKTSISQLPHMVWGNKPTDGGFLILSRLEKDELLSKYPNAKNFIKKYIGAQEFINGGIRWCLWITDTDKRDAITIPDINKRIENVRLFRLKSRAKSTQIASKRSHRFIQIQNEPESALIIPSHSSELREYIPIGFVQNNTVINNSCYVIYSPDPYIFSILTSKMHMLWTRTVAGKLETRIRYSSALCYNSFPFPNISKIKKNELKNITFAILEERERFSDKNLSQLYNQENMPDRLKDLHRENDLVIESCYSNKLFDSNEKRLNHLFELYEKISAIESTQSLFN